MSVKNAIKDAIKDGVKIAMKGGVKSAMKNYMKEKNQIIKTLDKYENKLQVLNTELAKLPTDRFCARKKGGHYIYCIRHLDEDGKRYEKYLPESDTKKITAYCEAAYLRRLISALEKETKALRKFARWYNPQAKYDAWNSLPEGYKQFAEPKIKSNEQICREWEHAVFNTNTFPFNEDARYITKKGEAVRSRIELIIANILYDLGIPYRYECELKLQSGTMYPDFTIMHPETLQVYYIEIFGMMDNPEYEASAFKKIARYAASDVYSRLIMFFDHKNAPISTENVRRTLEEIFC